MDLSNQISMKKENKPYIRTNHCIYDKHDIATQNDFDILISQIKATCIPHFNIFGVII